MNTLRNANVSYCHKGTIHYMVSGVKSHFGRHKKIKVKMPGEQILISEVISKAVAEATGAAIQAMAVATAERPQSMAGPKIGKPAMKQATFSQEAEDKYNKLKTFKLEVNNILTT